MKTITLKCSKCGLKLKVQFQPGLRLKCPQCGNRATLPETVPTAQSGSQPTAQAYAVETVSDGVSPDSSSDVPAAEDVEAGAAVLSRAGWRQETRSKKKRGAGASQGTAALRSTLGIAFQLDIWLASAQFAGYLLSAGLGLSLGAILGAVIFTPLFFVVIIAAPFLVVVIFLGMMNDSPYIRTFRNNLAWGLCWAGLGFLALANAARNSGNDPHASFLATLSHAGSSSGDWNGLAPVAGVVFLFLLSLLPNLPLVIMVVGTFFGTTRAFYNGAFSVDPEEANIGDLLIWIVVVFISSAVLAVGLLASAVVTGIFGFAVGAVLLLLLSLYGPMALALAGAFRVLNPVQVVRSIITCFPLCFPATAFASLHFLVVLVVLKLMFLYAFIPLAEVLLFWGWRSDEGVMAWCLASLGTVAMLAVFAVLCLTVLVHWNITIHAMMGTSLRNYSENLGFLFGKSGKRDRRLFSVRQFAIGCAAGLGFVAAQPLCLFLFLADPGDWFDGDTKVASTWKAPSLTLSRQSRRGSCTTNLKELGLAALNYHDTFRRFPAAASYSDSGEPLLSWRVHLLPFLGESALYQKFHLDEPWDSPHNLALAQQMPDVFRCPDHDGIDQHATYVAILGEETVMRLDGEPVRIRDVIAGTSNVVLFVEVSENQGVVWTRPADLIFDPESPRKGLGPCHGTAFHAVFVDGSVHRFTTDSGGDEFPFTDEEIRIRVSRKGR